MPRLGDLLLQAGRVTPAQIEDAARSQVAYGGRLGTNLVELGHLEIDELAIFLGRQHRLPPAQRTHFEQADATLQALLPAAIAGRLGVVPIARVAADTRRIAVATLSPLEPDAVRELAAALACEPGDLVFAVAAELRVLYNLERVYGIARPSRFLRTRRGGTEEFAVAPIDVDEASYDELAPPPPPPVEAARERTEDVELLELAPDDSDPGFGPRDQTTQERRRFVRTIADDQESGPIEAPVQTSLGRIELRKIAIAAAIEAGSLPPSGATTDECLRVIRRCRDREQIGALAVDCLDRQGGPGLDAGVLFIARGTVAVGWCGFSRGAVVAFEQLAVPLDLPSVIARAGGPGVRRIAPGAHPLEPLDERLIEALSFSAPTFVIAAPVVLGGNVLAYVYGQGRGDAGAAGELVIAVADATRAALTSLLRAAQR